MAETLPLETRDPVTLFLTGLQDLGPVAWAAIALASRDRDARQWEWDEAYQHALDAGGGWAAEVAARAADQSGSGPRAAAMASGAAAALAARSRLSPADFNLLFATVGDVLPAGTRREFEVYTSCMRDSIRPLPA